MVNVASSMVTMPPMRSGPCSSMRGASRRCSCAKSTSGGVVVGHRTGVSEEHGRLGIGRKGVRFEAKVGDRVYLEDRIAGGTGNRGFRCGVWGRHGDVAAKNFAGIL